jgi:protein-tyrosine phosphatase
MYRYVDWAHDQWAAGKNIQFGCHGAHGRTGTFAALLFLRSGVAKTGMEAIDMVRDFHCEEAIETVSQENAIYAYAKKLYGDEAGIEKACSRKKTYTPTPNPLTQTATPATVPAAAV